jgi:hypothetical protein
MTNGLPDFDRLRHHHHDDGAFLYAFDLIELASEDLRPRPARDAQVHVVTPRHFHPDSRTGIRGKAATTNGRLHDARLSS